MPISLVQGASANASSVAFSAPKVGDVIVVFSYNNASVTIPTLVAGYTTPTNGTTSTTLSAARVGWKISNGTETSSGTWTNGTNTVALIYRGANTATPVGTVANGVGNSTALSYPTIALTDAGGLSWVVGVGGAKAATAGMNGTTAALTSNRTNQTTVNGLDTNAGVATFAAQTLNVTTSGRWICFSIEVIANTAAASSTGAATATGTGKSNASAGASSAGTATASFAAPLVPIAWYQYNRGITVTGTGVSQWDDQSGNARHLLQATDGDRPPQQPGGTILFDGVTDYLATANFTLNQPHTVYLLARQVTWTSADRFLAGTANPDGMNIYQTTSSPGVGIIAGTPLGKIDLTLNAYGIITAVFNGASSVLSIDGGTDTTGDAGALSAGGISLAKYSTVFGNIEAKELIVFDTAHDSAARTVVYNYLTNQLGSASSATGVAAVVAAASSLASGYVSSAGQATATAAGKSLSNANISSAGISTSAVAGQSKASGAISSAGVATAVASAQSNTAGTISSSGAATVTAAGADLAQGAVSSFGATVAQAASTSRAAGNIAGAGMATVDMEGTSTSGGAATGDIYSAGVATVVADSASAAQADAYAAGTSTMTMVGASSATVIRAVGGAQRHLKRRDKYLEQALREDDEFALLLQQLMPIIQGETSHARDAD